MVDRKHRELSDDEIARITDTYHAYRGETKQKYRDVLGFCKSVNLEEIKNKKYSLNPSQYIGFEDVIEDEQLFHEKLTNLYNALEKQFSESVILQKNILSNLKKLKVNE